MRKINRAAGTVFTAAALALTLAPAAGATTATPTRAAGYGYWESIAVNSQRIEFTATAADRLVARQAALSLCANSPRTGPQDTCHILHNYFHSDGS